LSGSTELHSLEQARARCFAGSLHGRDLNLGSLSPEALVRLVASFGELRPGLLIKRPALCFTVS